MLQNGHALWDVHMKFISKLNAIRKGLQLKLDLEDENILCFLLFKLCLPPFNAQGCLLPFSSNVHCNAMQFMKVTINNDTPKDNLMTGRGKRKEERGVRCVQVDNLNALVIWVHPKNNYCIITTFLPSIYTLWLLLRLLPWCIAGSSNIRTILCRVVAMRIIIL